MLVRFSVENFMSFNTNVSFSMAASKIARMKDHLITVDDKRILRGLLGQRRISPSGSVTRASVLLSAEL